MKNWAERAIPLDSNWKLLPPLRGADDAAALLEGLADGTIDFICTNHTPCDRGQKPGIPLRRIWHDRAANRLCVVPDVPG